MHYAKNMKCAEGAELINRQLVFVDGRSSAAHGRVGLQKPACLPTTSSRKSSRLASVAAQYMICTEDKEEDHEEQDGCNEYLDPEVDFVCCVDEDSDELMVVEELDTKQKGDLQATQGYGHSSKLEFPHHDDDDLDEYSDEDSVNDKEDDARSSILDFVGSNADDDDVIDSDVESEVLDTNEPTMQHFSTSGTIFSDCAIYFPSNPPSNIVPAPLDVTACNSTMSSYASMSHTAMLLGMEATFPDSIREGVNALPGKASTISGNEIRSFVADWDMGSCDAHGHSYMIRWQHR